MANVTHRDIVKKKQDVLNTYRTIMKLNNKDIPDDILDFMMNSAIDKLLEEEDFCINKLLEIEKKSNNWHIHITSEASLYGLTAENIDKIFNSYKCEEFISFRKECDDKKNDIPEDDYYRKKHEEVTDSFYKNITYDIKDGKLKLSIQYDISFPKDFFKRDVLEWIDHLVDILTPFNISNDFLTIDRKSLRPFSDELLKKCKCRVRKILMK